MKKILILFFTTIFTVSLATSNLYSIDLVALSKKEKERRKKIKKKKKKLVITDETLKKYKNKNISFTITNKIPEDTSNLKKNAISRNEINNQKNSKEAYWKNMKRNFEIRINSIKQAIKKIQLQLNKVTTDYYLTEIPLKKNELNQKRIKLIKELEKLKLELKKAEKDYEDFKDKARRKGIPPGWIR